MPQENPTINETENGLNKIFEQISLLTICERINVKNVDGKNTIDVRNW